MKNIILISLFVFSFSGIAPAEEPKVEVPQAQIAKAEPSPVGIWLVPAGDAKIEVYQKGEELEGKIIWLKEPLDKDGKEKTDTKNPDEKLRNTPIMNLVFLKGFKKEKDENKWSGGTVYDAKSGSLYKGWIKPEGEKILKLRGYVGISLFGRTEEWTRQ